MPTPALRATALWINLCALAFLGGLAAYAYWFEKPFLTFPVMPIPALADEVEAGRPVPLFVQRCNSDDHAHVYPASSRLINDDDPGAAQILLPGINSVRLEAGCTTITSNVNQIPLLTPYARYHIDGLSEIRGIWKTYLVPWRTTSFRVVAPGSLTPSLTSPAAAASSPMPAASATAR